jgi:OmpA-OmpF porin, OOP family
VRLRSPAALTFLALLLAPASALAQSQAPRFQLDPVQPASPQSPFLTVEGPSRPAHHGGERLSASILVDYARSPLTVRRADDARAGSPVSDALLLHAGLGLQLVKGLSADLAVPVALMLQGNDTKVGSTTIPAPSQRTALGDVRVGALYRGWTGRSFGYVAGVRLRTPTGSRDAYMSDRRLHPEVLAGVFGQADPLRAGCTVYFDPLFASARRGDRLAGGCAGDVRISRSGAALGAEFLAAGLRYADDVSPRGLFEIWATLRHPLGPLQATLAAGPGMGNAPGLAAFRAMAAIAWAPQQALPAGPADRDLDGILDADDACPAEAGPKSREPGRNGCPNLDSDGDGVPDHLDACPQKPGAPSPDKVVTGCPDSDNDGVADKVDLCPREPAEAGNDPRTLGCAKRARLSGDRFVLHPPLGEVSAAADIEALREIAFALRADSSIRKLSVEVTLTGSDTDEPIVDRAVERAGQIVQQLIELGVERKRLDPVGAVSTLPFKINFVVTDKSAPNK